MKAEDKGILNSSKIEFSLDVEGQECPLPLLRIKSFLSRMASGQLVAIAGVSSQMVTMIEEWCARSGHSLCCTDHVKDGRTRVTIKKG